MRFREALYHLKKYFIGSDKWNGLSILDKKAIEKSCIALANMNGWWKTEKDYSLPITYYTRGKVECKKNTITNTYYIAVDGRVVFEVLTPNDCCRGHRHEIAIYDNTVDKKALHEIIEPQLIGDAVLIHDAYDYDEWCEMDKEEKRLMKGS